MIQLNKAAPETLIATSNPGVRNVSAILIPSHCEACSGRLKTRIAEKVAMSPSAMPRTAFVPAAG